MTLVEVRTEGASLLEGYRSIVGDGPIRVLEALARRLRGHRIAMVNSTAAGGGVAEILHRLVRLLNELGVRTTWEGMPRDARFHGITQTIHNSPPGPFRSPSAPAAGSPGGARPGTPPSPASPRRSTTRPTAPPSG